MTTLYGIYFIDDFNGWVVGANGTILYTTTGGTVGVKDVVKDLDIDIYPNPTTNSIQINLGDNLQIEGLELLNSNGQFIGLYHDDNTMDLSALPPGLYYLRIETDQGVHVERIVKE